MEGTGRWRRAAHRLFSVRCRLVNGRPFVERVWASSNDSAQRVDGVVLVQRIHTISVVRLESSRQCRHVVIVVVVVGAKICSSLQNAGLVTVGGQKPRNTYLAAGWWEHHQPSLFPSCLHRLRGVPTVVRVVLMEEVVPSWWLLLWSSLRLSLS